MKASLIVGLGNPGSQYQSNRHNLGFRVVDALRSTLDQAADWHHEGDAAVAHTAGQPRIFLLKPQTFMNGSGQPVARFVKFYRVLLDRLWVVHDDVDVLFGELRPAFDRGSAGHQGVESIVRALGSKAFHRLRIGVGSNRQYGLAAEDYVLQNFTPEEEQQLTAPDGIIAQAAASLMTELTAKNKGAPA
ncbi:MAG: aminoacyl-tRNA hydrolase [Candidatus Kerfeldbacteria bacterium]|nr:aminoacyl-tRNA hydrolase [Candidatus Kerfeldbacteria bacterium]